LELNRGMSALCQKQTFVSRNIETFIRPPARSGYAPPRSLDRDTTRLDGTTPAHNLVGNEFMPLADIKRDASVLSDLKRREN
jgi:hypothetical protein